MQSRIHNLVNGKAGKIYRKLVATIDYKSPYKFIEVSYEKYKSDYGSDKNTNGRIFEYLVCETLAQQGITPFYYQAKFERVPNVEFDIVLYDPYRPVVLTMKTSLRERYKQADLEGAALRQVYRQADVYLITMSVKEANGVMNKINDGAVMGLTQCIVASNMEYNTLLEEMKQRKFSSATPVTPVDGKLLFKL